jgi:hypothetical protein
MSLPGLEGYGSSSDEEIVGSGSGNDGAGAASPAFGERGAHGRGRSPPERRAALEANEAAVGASGSADGAPTTTGTASAALVAGVAGEEPPSKKRRGRPLGKVAHNCGHKDCQLNSLRPAQQKRYISPAREAQRVGVSASKTSPGPMTRLGAVGGAVTEGPRRGRSASASSPPPQSEHSQTRQAAVWPRWDRAGQSEAFPAGRREGCCGTYDAGCDHTLMTRSRRCRRTWISSKRRRID